MNDLEERLSQMLATRADSASATDDLVQGARIRHRRRRMTRGIGATAVVAAIAVAVPLGLSLGEVEKGDEGVAKQPELTEVSIPIDWRFESYHDVEFAVPPTWEHGSVADWCAAGGSAVPRVERPGAVALSIGCPTSGYGVVIGRVPDNPPAGASVRSVRVEGVTLTVLTEDPAVADLVVGSAQAIGGTDFYQCKPVEDVPALGEMQESSDLGRGGVVTTCRYELGVEGANLVGSELVPDKDADSFWLGFESAEPGKGPDNKVANCDDSIAGETQAVLVKTGGEPYAWVHYSGCYGHGIDVGGTTYKLNAQVTYWTLPPGGDGGYLDGSIPLPKEGRPRP